MKINSSILDNENGSAIVLVLIVLAALTIMGISSISSNTIELQIVRNEQIYQTNFYQAESSAYEAAQRLEQEQDTDQLIPDTSGYDWVNDNTLDFSIDSTWLDDGSVNDNSDQSLIDPNVHYSVVGRGVRSGSSLDIGATRLYEFSSYGISESNNGQAMVEIGYLRRF